MARLTAAQRPAMDEFLHPLFLWPLLAGLVVGIGVTVRVYRRR